MDWQRNIHDLWANVAGATRGMPLTLDEAPQACLAGELQALQKAGEADLDNGFEEKVLGKSSAGAELPLTWPEAKLYPLRDVFTCGVDGSIYFPGGRLFSPSFRASSPKATKVRRPVPGMARRIEGEAFHLVGPNYENHGHFMIDFLPRVILAQQAGLDLSAMKILVGSGQSRWQARYLAYFGIRPEQLIETDGGTLAFKRLNFIPLPIGFEKLAPPPLYAELRARFLPEAAEQWRRDQPAIFISRQDAPDKRLLNEPDVVAALREVDPDLRLIDLAKHPLAEQIELFNRARAVIGPTGQGLTPILFVRDQLFLQIGWTNFYKKPSWIRAFHLLALQAGNHAVSLLNDTPRPPDGSWWFEPARCAQAYEQALKAMEPIQ